MQKLNLPYILLAAILILQPSFSQFQLEEAFPNLPSFTRPVDLQHAGDGSNRLFVVEQEGLIHVFENDVNVAQRSVVLDIRNRVDDSGNEEGLLGLAFHPDFENNGYFFVNYTSHNRTTRISRFVVSSSDSNVAEPDSEVVFLEFNQPFSNHNGGQVVFGPNDGYLYISTGDGGSGGDPACNAQNLETLLGNILRIDVDQPSGNLHYSIPPDNPFAGNTDGYREEIFAYGLRNPWRISFDPVTGWLWGGDVGQNDWEEVDVIESGKNYGWNMWEAMHCYTSAPPCAPPCDTSGVEMPVWEYSHSLGFSITGGYVYRGPTVPELTGKYIYADFGTGRIWALEYDGVNPPSNTQLLNTTLNIAAFGTDPNRELYLCAFDGNIYRFSPTVTGPKGSLPQIPTSFELGQNYPNPFNPSTTIPFFIDRQAGVSINVYNGQGKLVNNLIDDTMSPGQHTVEWRGQDFAGNPLSSGIYFYQLKIDDEARQTRRMTLLK